MFFNGEKEFTYQQFSSQKSQNEKEILTLFCLFLFFSCYAKGER